VIEDIIKSRVDGVILYDDRVVMSEIETLTKYNIPIVFIGHRMSKENIASVYVDIRKAVYELTMKYLEFGKDNIAIIEDRKNRYACEQMVEGAEMAFKAKGKTFQGFLPIPGDMRTSYAFMSRWLKDHKYDLMIGYRDSQAMAIVNAARENDIAVPNEMEVACVIDTKYNAMMRPQISSFSIPSYDLGAVSMRVMTKMLSNEMEADRMIELSYLFTPRQTTKN
jgi:LacI family transcriptional regulator